MFEKLDSRKTLEPLAGRCDAVARGFDLIYTYVYIVGECLHITSGGAVFQKNGGKSLPKMESTRKEKKNEI
jgi:hypothetical protein